MKIVACIQVRMNSSRLSKKALKKIYGKTSIEWVIESTKRLKYIDEIVIATTKDNSDNELVDFLESIKQPYYRGSVENVASRLYESGKAFGADHVVRIVGDHPLNSYELLDFLIEDHLKSNNDFTSLNRENIAVGVLSEVINQNAFARLLNYNLNFSYSEYLTYFFTKNTSFFDVKLLNAPKKYQSNPFRLTLDYNEDYILLEKLIEVLLTKYKDINHQNIIEEMTSNKDLNKINSNLKQKFQQKDILDKILNACTIDKNEKN